MAKKATSNKGKKIHVISRNGGWAVKTEGTARASKVYGTKAAAVNGAKKTSKGRDVIVHKKDGSIEKWQKSR